MKSFIIIVLCSLCCIQPNLARRGRRRLSKVYFPERQCRVTGPLMQKTIYVPSEVREYEMLQVILSREVGNSLTISHVHLDKLICNNTFAPSELSQDTFNDIVETWERPIGKAECFKDALRIWYLTKEKNTIYDHKLPNILIWTNLTIFGIRPKTDSYQIPLLDVFGMVVAPKLPNKCMNIGSEKKESSKCLRYSPQLKECPSNKECVSIGHEPYGCQCLQGYQEDASGNCQDIDECAPDGEGAISCESKKKDCINIAGRYICVERPKTTSESPSALPSTTPPCLASELNLGNQTHQYCVNKKALIPPEIRCNIDIHPYEGETVKARMIAITALVDDVRTLERLSDKTVTLTWTTTNLDANNNNTFTNWTTKTKTTVCKNYAATFIPTEIMFIHSYHKSYEMRDYMAVNKDMSNHLANLYKENKVSASGAACYADVIVFWTVGDTLLRQVNVTSADTGLIIPDTKDVTIDFDPTHPLPFGNNTCKSYTVSDKCFDKSKLHAGHCKAQNSVCINKGHDTFGCACRRGYSRADGDCVDNTLCSPGLNVVNNLCVDIDECTGGGNMCGPELICVNYYGGYSCIDSKHCGQGFTYDTTNNRCVDVDECALGTSGCDNDTTICKNLHGGVECVCKTKGYAHTASVKACEPPRFEYRLLDPEKIRCCSHRGHQSSAVLTRFTMNVHGEYLDVTPMFCIHVSPVRVLAPNAYATPFLVDSSLPPSMVSLEAECLLDYVKIMQNMGTFKDNDVLVDIQYTDGCEIKFKLTNTNTTTFDRHIQQLYLLKTPVSHTYYDMTKTGFGSRNCYMPFPTNIDWYKEKLTQKPTARPRYTCMTGSENSAMSTTTAVCVLSISFIIQIL